MGQELKKELGLLHVVMLCTGALMGTDILIIPGIVGGMMGPGTILLWVLAGALIIPLGLCFVELSSGYSVTGGPYVYVREAAGDFFGFLTGWSTWIIACTYIGTQAITMRYYLGYFHSFTQVETTIFYAAIIGLLTLINYIGVKRAGSIQLLLMAGTLLFFLIFIAVGLPKVNLENFNPLFPLGMSALGMTMILILEPFFGWEAMTVVAGEVKDTKRTMPLGLIISTAIVVGIILLTVFVTLGVLNWRSMAGSASPLADVMQFAYGGYAGTLVALGAIILSMACMNALVLTTSRIPYAMAKDKLFLESFSQLSSRFRTPGKSLLIQAAFGFFIALLGSYEGSIFLLMSNSLILYAMCAFAVIKLKSKPVERLVDLHIGVPISAMIICLFFLIQVPVLPLFSGLLLILFGIPLYTLIKVQYDKKFVENFYDTFSFLYDILSPIWYGSGKREKVILNAKVKERDIVLDYGCATGADVLDLGKIVGKNGKIVAVDISIKQLEKGVEKLRKLPGIPGNIAFVKEDEQPVPFEPSTFDVIISVGVLSYKEQPTELLRMLRKALKKGGRVSILDFGRVMIFPRPKYLKSQESIKETFKKAGFKQINIEKVGGLLFEYYYITAKR